jgi:hypothetical protein
VFASLGTCVARAWVVWLSAAGVAIAQPVPEGAPPTAAAPTHAAGSQHPDCARMLLDAAAALRNEQYPAMSQLAAERQKTCPGPDSLFLLGLARANMLHKGLVPHASETLVRAQAVHALSTAVDSGQLRGEWLQPANAWLQYLERADRALMDITPSPALPPEPSPTVVPVAASPFEPDPSHTGSLILASAGIALLGAGLVTAIFAGNLGPYDDSSTLDTATSILVLTGGVALVSALTWHLLTPRPHDKIQVAASARLSPTMASAAFRLSF